MASLILNPTGQISGAGSEGGVALGTVGEGGERLSDEDADEAPRETADDSFPGDLVPLEDLPFFFGMPGHIPATGPSSGIDLAWDTLDLGHHGLEGDWDSDLGNGALQHSV